MRFKGKTTSTLKRGYPHLDLSKLEYWDTAGRGGGSGEGRMENILSIIKGKNLDEVSGEELTAFQLEIEEALANVNKLQLTHRELTGRNYVPPVRL